MTDLLEWAERQFRVVEQDGACVSSIKLVTAHDGEVWETWQAPWGEAADWVTGAEAFLRSLENEWPNRGVSVCFIASSSSGEVLSRYPRKVQGKNKQGGAPWNTDQAAVSMAMDNLALTMEKFQRLLNTQLDSARKTAESNAVTMYQQTELIKLMRQNAATEEAEGGGDDALTKLVSEHGSDFIDLAKLYLQSKAKSTKPTNGAITTALKTTKE